MKALSVATVVVLSCATLLSAQNRYQEKSGVIEYAMTGGGKMMGVETKVSGTSTQYFKDYGNTFLTKEKTVQETMGSKQMDEQIVKMENDTVYSVDLEKKMIVKFTLNEQMKQLSFATSSEANLKKSGGKKVGSDKIAGYKCDIWELKNEKMCVYKGIPLRMTTTQMGITHTQTATSVKFQSVSDDKFKLPSYPVKTQGDLMQEAQKELQQQMKNMSPEEKKMMEEMMKKMMGTQAPAK